MIDNNNNNNNNNNTNVPLINYIYTNIIRNDETIGRGLLSVVVPGAWMRVWFF